MVACQIHDGPIGLEQKNGRAEKKKSLPFAKTKVAKQASRNAANLTKFFNTAEIVCLCNPELNLKQQLLKKLLL